MSSPRHHLCSTLPCQWCGSDSVQQVTPGAKIPGSAVETISCLLEIPTRSILSRLILHRIKSVLLGRLHLNNHSNFTQCLCSLGKQTYRLKESSERHQQSFLDSKLAVLCSCKKCSNKEEQGNCTVTCLFSTPYSLERKFRELC